MPIPIELESGLCEEIVLGRVLAEERAGRVSEWRHESEEVYRIASPLERDRAFRNLALGSFAKTEAAKSDATVNPAPSGNVISEAQGKRFYAIYKGAGKTNEDVAGYLHQNYGISSSREIKKSDYEALCTWAAQKSDLGSAQ